MRPGTRNSSVRPPAVAGLFYADDPTQLRETVSAFLRHPAPGPVLDSRLLIAPHAGHSYSGSIAAAAYACVASRRAQIRRVVLLGPSHRVHLRGFAIPQAEAFATPLGEVPIDPELKSIVLARVGVIESDVPHAREHCLEVHLPFLQTLLDDFTLLPLVLGVVTPAEVAALLEDVCGGEETLVIASSDLSHYHSYDLAQRIDAATSAAILRRATDLSGDQACGAVGINGLLEFARGRDLSVREIARCNSGDTAGDRTRVVGYGAFALHGPVNAAAM